MKFISFQGKRNLRRCNPALETNHFGRILSVLLTMVFLTSVLSGLAPASVQAAETAINGQWPGAVVCQVDGSIDTIYCVNRTVPLTYLRPLGKTLAVVDAPVGDRVAHV